MSRRSRESCVGGAIAAVVLAALAASPAAAQGGAIRERAHPAVTTTAASAAPPADESQAPDPVENPVLKFFGGTELTGLVDTYYSYNFNTPKTPCSSLAGISIFNCLRAFDVAHNAFSLNLAELALEKKPSTDSRAGFRIDLDYGASAALGAGFEPAGATPIYQHVQQAYVSYLASAGQGRLQFDFGKFVTPAGLEVFESKDNWNYSRGLLFTLALPSYHQGLRVAYSPTDRTSITGFVFNGWNNSVENNGGKSVGIQFIGKPTGAWAVTANYIGGPEVAHNNDDWRHLLDLMATYTTSPMISVAFNYDIGKELSTTWQGIAVYLKYRPNAWFALAPRYEFFNDKDGWALIGQHVQEFTLTGELKHKDGPMMRIEYRGDATQDPFFVKNTNEAAKVQNTLTIAWVYAFSTKMP